MYEYFTAVDFEKYKLSLGLKETIPAEKAVWNREPNGVMACSLLPKGSIFEDKLSYLGLIFPKPTSAHYYKTQTDTILFKGPGKVEFFHLNSPEEIQTYSVQPGNAVQIPREVVRRLIPVEGNLEIELVVRPKYKASDEVLVGQ